MASACTLGCGGGGASPVASPPPPPSPSITVTITPATASLLLGTTQQFSAAVRNTSNVAVAWSVGGIVGGNAVVGTITADGNYTAPQMLATQNVVSVRATTSADPRVSDAAQVTIRSDIAMTMFPPSASVELGAMKEFSARMTSAGRIDPGIRWSISGAGCDGASCGTTDFAGIYTAPQVLPVAPDVTLAAQSVADPSKQASAAIHITSSFTVSIAGPASVGTGDTREFTATIQAPPGSNPSRNVAWLLSGTGCTGSACGTISASQSSSGTSIAVFTAPGIAPSPNIVSLSVVPAADPSKAVSRPITISATSPDVSVRVTPLSAALALNHRQAITVQVTGTPNKNVTWQVNGIPGGSPLVGQICAASSSPCQPVIISNSSTVDYLAPGAIPQPNPVSVVATSQADTSQFAGLPVTVLAHLAVVVSPPSVTLASSSTQQFSATVLGSEDQNVIWQLQGAACSAIGAPCGVINANGVYNAPLFAPSPNTFQVVATSAEDIAQSGLSQVTIATGSNISKLLPASIFAGAAGGFTLRVQGSGFTPTVPGPGSTIQVGSSTRNTNCLSAGDCTTTLSAGDIRVSGNLPIQVRNPSGTLSNQVMFVVAAPVAGTDLIALTPTTPSASRKDIVTVELSTAGTSAAGANVDLNVAALGAFSVPTNTCSLGGNTVPLTRPAAEWTIYDICLFSMSGLEAGMDYTISGPSDVMINGKQPVGLGIIHLTLQISRSAAQGPRTLFIENSNKDKAAATGVLEVK